MRRAYLKTGPGAVVSLEAGSSQPITGGGGGLLLDAGRQLAPSQPIAGMSVCVQTAFLLFEDLCALAGGSAAAWLRVPPLPKAFALDMIEFTLSQHADVFEQVPAFQRALGGRLCALLMTNLRGWDTNAFEAEAASVAERRLVLRVVGTIVRKFNRVLATECEIFLTTLLRSLEGEMAPWLRSYILEVLRGLALDKDLLLFLHDTYDMNSGSAPVYHDVVLILARIVQAGMAPQPDSGVDDILGAVSVLFRSKSQGVDMVPEPDDGAGHIAYAVFLSLEAMLGAAHSVAALADRAVEGRTSDGGGPGAGGGSRSGGGAAFGDTGEGASERLDALIAAEADGGHDTNRDGGGVEGRNGAGPKAGGVASAAVAGTEAMTVGAGGDGTSPIAGDGRGDPDAIASVCAMIESVWEMLLSTMSLVLTQATGEALLLELLRAYQALTQAAGVLRVDEARDAFLASLCHFALASPRSAPPSTGNHAGVGGDYDGYANSPRANQPAVRSSASGHLEGGFGGGSGGGSGGGPYVQTVKGSGGATSGAANTPSRALAWPGSGDHERIILTPKNVQALRTLFNVAHRLASSLGGAWFLILETMNALERALDAPGTTTAENVALGRAGHKRSGSQEGLNGDLAVLTVAAQQLFESTAQLTDVAMLDIAAALRQVSAKELRDMGGGGGKAPVAPGARLFMLERLVDVTLANMLRVHKLWPQVEAHFFDMAATETSGELCCVISKQLRRVLLGMLGQRFSPEADAAAATLGADYYECVVLAPLPRLMQEAAAPEARVGALEVLLSILQERGDKIRRGWRVVLRMLTAAAEWTDHRGVGVGVGVGGASDGVVFVAFACISVIAADLLPYIPDAALPEVVTAVGAFGRQRADVNTSLTAIGLLWNMTDFFGRLVDALPEERGRTIDLADTGTAAGMNPKLSTLDSKP